MRVIWLARRTLLLSFRRFANLVRCEALAETIPMAAPVDLWPCHPELPASRLSERDPDASFTVKNDETPLAIYKLHLAVDEESGLVRQAEMTSADLIPPGRSLRGRRVGGGREAQGRGRQPVRLTKGWCASSRRGSSAAWSSSIGRSRPMTMRASPRRMRCGAFQSSRPGRPRR